MTDKQPETNTAPANQQDWVAFLQEKSLPIRNSVLMRLQRKLQDPDASLHDIGLVVRADPSLCLAVVKTAATRHQAINSRVTSLDHAINSLGLNELSALRYQLTPHRLSAKSVAQKMYFRSLAISHHASVQCSKWLSQRKSPFMEESCLATLFYGVGYWFLWQHATQHMCEIQIRIREQQREPQLAENDVLGCTVDQISSGLLQAWGISDLAQEGLEHNEVSNRQVMRQLHRRALDENSLSTEARREVNLLIQQKFFPIKLANWLAQNVDLGWQRPGTIQVVDVINDFLKSNITATQTLLHTTCVAAARLYHVPGTLAPAAELLMLPSSHTINYRLEPTEAETLKLQPALRTAENEPSEPAGPLHNNPIDPEHLQRSTQRLTQVEQCFQQPKEVLRELLSALSRGLGFERAALYIINPRHQSLKTAFSLGFPDQHPVTRFSFDYQIPSLLKQLSEQAKVVSIRPEHRQKVLRFLPEAYQQWSPVNGFILLSVFSDNQPVAIVHVDCGMGGDRISDQQHQAVIKLAHLTSQGLTLLQQRKATAEVK
ncbi:HDOD domain-containing protein [Pontibacter sp. JAM-7]|uniref:HDOD domain-containing protein n=1 Tax=Pontibacter sp. JAM-7 TaxID=3366581 RepID=UPI003AF591AB